MRRLKVPRLARVQPPSSGRRHPVIARVRRPHLPLRSRSQQTNRCPLLVDRLQRCRRSPLVIAGAPGHSIVRGPEQKREKNLDFRDRLISCFLHLTCLRYHLHQFHYHHRLRPGQLSTLLLISVGAVALPLPYSYRPRSLLALMPQAIEKMASPGNDLDYAKSASPPFPTYPAAMKVPSNPPLKHPALFTAILFFLN